MIYNFRIDRNERQEIIRRINEESLLSQGWGGNDVYLDINSDDYTTLCKNRYNLNSTRIATSIRKIRKFKDGDILVTPHLPENGKVSIHIVDGDYPNCYHYLPNDETQLNNRVKIKKSYGLDGSISIYNHELVGWYGKLPWIRLPVQEIKKYEETFKRIISHMEQSVEVRFDTSGLEEYLNHQFATIIHQLKKNLYQLSPNNSRISFEKICEHILIHHGYEIQRRNKYNSAGGDIDLLCTRNRKDSSPFETGQTTLFVQVKKHTGTTDKRAVEQLIEMMKEDPSADGCVMSLADDFDDEAVNLAEEKEILLMNGETITRLLLQSIMNQE